MTDAEILDEFKGYRCWTYVREQYLRMAIKRGRGIEAWEAAKKRFWDGKQNSSLSSATFVIPGAGVDDEGFGVALEQECRRVLDHI